MHKNLPIFLVAGPCVWFSAPVVPLFLKISAVMCAKCAAAEGEKDIEPIDWLPYV